MIGWVCVMFVGRRLAETANLQIEPPIILPTGRSVANNEGQ